MEFPRINNSVRVCVICELLFLLVFSCIFLYSYYTPQFEYWVGECIGLVITAAVVRCLIIWIVRGPIATSYLIADRVVLPVNGWSGHLSKKESLEFVESIRGGRARACYINMYGQKVCVNLTLQSNGVVAYSKANINDVILDSEIREMLASSIRFTNKNIYVRRSILFLAICTSRGQFVNGRAYKYALLAAMKVRNHFAR